jgi:hypothetical protein
VLARCLGERCGLAVERERRGRGGGRDLLDTAGERGQGDRMYRCAAPVDGGRGGALAREPLDDIENALLQGMR